jgi:hypothetical protein
MKKKKGSKKKERVITVYKGRQEEWVHDFSKSLVGFS